MLQRVRKGCDKPCVIRRLCGEVGASLVAREEDGLRRPRPAVSLDPETVRPVQRPNPKANLFRSQGRVGHFQHDTAHIFLGEEIRAGELEIVYGTDRVEEERVTSPADAQPVLASSRYPRLPIHGDRRPFDDNLPIIAHSGGSGTFNVEQRRGLTPVRKWREAYSVGNVGDSIAIRVYLELVQRVRRE